METTVSKCDIHEDQHTKVQMQFGNRGRICSSRLFKRQQSCLVKTTAFFLLELQIVQSAIVPNDPLMGSSWRGMPEMATQDDARRSHSPLTCAKQRNITSKKRKHSPTLMQRWCCWRTRRVCTSEPRHRPTETPTLVWRSCKISPNRFSLRWTRMRSLPVQQGTAAEHAHGLTYQKRRLRTRCSTASAAIDSVFSPCSDRRWPCVLCQTLHPLRHDARSEGQLHGTGARPGGWPSGFLLMEDRINQQRNGREGTSVSKSAWALLWLW